MPKTKRKTTKGRKARQQNKCWVISVLVSSFCPCRSLCLSFFVASVFCVSFRMCFGAFLSVSVVGCVLWLWLLLSLWCLPWPLGVLVAQLVLRHSCVADRLPVVVRFPAGPLGSLKKKKWCLPWPLLLPADFGLPWCFGKDG